jgi:hypothetical protein
MTEYESYLRSWTPPPAGLPEFIYRPVQARQRLSDAYVSWRRACTPPTRISGLSIEDEQ